MLKICHSCRSASWIFFFSSTRIFTWRRFFFLRFRIIQFSRGLTYGRIFRIWLFRHFRLFLFCWFQRRVVWLETLACSPVFSFASMNSCWNSLVLAREENQSFWSASWEIFQKSRCRSWVWSDFLEKYSFCSSVSVDCWRTLFDAWWLNCDCKESFLHKSDWYIRHEWLTSLLADSWWGKCEWDDPSFFIMFHDKHRTDFSSHRIVT